MVEKNQAVTGGIVAFVTIGLLLILILPPSEERTLIISNDSGGSNVTELNDLSDVDLNFEEDGELLRYNGTYWINSIDKWASVGEIYQSITKTNIGSSYADVYSPITSFDEEEKFGIDCSQIIELRFIFQWDYVGTGTQQVRLVDATNPNNVLIESSTFTADQSGDLIGDGDLTTSKPSWCIGSVYVKWQAKSTVAGDDPIAKGYKLLVR